MTVQTPCPALRGLLPSTQGFPATARRVTSEWPWPPRRAPGPPKTSDEHDSTAGDDAHSSDTPKASANDDGGPDASFGPDDTRPNRSSAASPLTLPADTTADTRNTSSAEQTSALASSNNRGGSRGQLSQVVRSGDSPVRRGREQPKLPPSRTRGGKLLPSKPRQIPVSGGGRDRGFRRSCGTRRRAWPGRRGCLRRPERCVWTMAG